MAATVTAFWLAEQHSDLAGVAATTAALVVGQVEPQSLFSTATVAALALVSEQQPLFAAAVWAFASWQHSLLAGLAATVAAFWLAEQHSDLAGVAETTAARDVAAQQVVFSTET